MLEHRIEQDLKTALLGGDSLRVSTLRGLKSALLNYKVDKGKRDTGVDDDEAIALLSKEAKKRQESADLYISGGDQERADKELAEKAIIEAYLPPKLSSEKVALIVDAVIESIGRSDKGAMGQIIAEVKIRSQGAADGALIAQLVKAKLDL